MSDQMHNHPPADSPARAELPGADHAAVRAWFDAHAAELTAPLPADDHGVSEAEYAALIMYVSGEGTPAERAALEHRLTTEPTLAALADAIQATWTLPLPQMPKPLPEPSRDVEDSLQRLYQRAATTTPRADGKVDQTSDVSPDAAITASVSAPDTSHVLAFPARRPSRRVPHWAALAAALLVVWLGAGVATHLRGPAYYYTGGSTGTTVTLPDGSVATLAPGSYLGTDHGFPIRTRVVHLYGEASFRVVPNARVPFIVRTPGVHTRVLGTSFTVHFDTTATWRITVATGAVSIAMSTGPGRWRTVQTLTAGQALHVPFLLTWMAQVGHELRTAGVPMGEAVRLEGILRHAAIRLGAEAAREAEHAK